jgi:cytochrome c oxidase subunit 3
MYMSAESTERKRIHPHKFTLWVAMGSIVMMFAGLTSAYVVKRNQANWLEFSLPAVFWYSTVVILLSSATMHLAVKSFKAREMPRYKILITITLALGLLFCGLQFAGFNALHKNGVQLFGIGSNPSASFLGIITGLHIAHVLGGVIALLVVFIRAFSIKNKQYSSVPVEIVSTYWHFVDVLWIYLFIFFSWIG